MSDEKNPMGRADIVELSRRLFAEMGDKIDGFEWEESGRVFCIRRERPREITEYCGDALAAWKRQREDMEQRLRREVTL